jgi:hypothetical protein
LSLFFIQTTGNEGAGRLKDIFDWQFSKNQITGLDPLFALLNKQTPPKKKKKLKELIKEPIMKFSGSFRNPIGSLKDHT